MGLILDSSVVIAAERRGETVQRLIEGILSVTGDQEAALSAVGLAELVHRDKHQKRVYAVNPSSMN